MKRQVAGNLAGAWVAVEIFNSSEKRVITEFEGFATVAETGCEGACATSRVSLDTGRLHPRWFIAAPPLLPNKKRRFKSSVFPAVESESGMNRHMLHNFKSHIFNTSTFKTPAEHPSRDLSIRGGLS